MAERLPSPGQFVDDDLKDLFVETIDQVIADLGRAVVLYFEPTASGCPNCGVGMDLRSNGVYDSNNPFTLNGPFNRPFPNGGECPICAGTHEILTESSQTWTSTIGRRPKDIDFTAEGVNPENVVTTKMVIEAYDDIKRTKKALIDGNLYVLLREPVKTGLKDLKYVRATWIKIGT